MPNCWTRTAWQLHDSLDTSSSSLSGADLAAGCWAPQSCHTRRRSPAWPSPARPAPAACPGALLRAGPRPGRRRHSPAGFQSISSCQIQHGLSPIWHCSARSQPLYHCRYVTAGCKMVPHADGAWLSVALPLRSATRASLPLPCTRHVSQLMHVKIRGSCMEAQPSCATALHTSTDLTSRRGGLVACMSATRNAPLRSLSNRVQEAALHSPIQNWETHAVRRLTGANAAA